MKKQEMGIAAAAVLAAVLGLLAAAPAGAQLVDYFGGKNKINYDTFNWRVYESEHFNIYYYPEEEEYLDEVVNWAETAYEIISQRLNHQLVRRVPILFFKTHSEFEQTNVVPMFLPEGVGAFAEPRLGRIVIPLDDPPAAMQRLFTHELTHAFQFDIWRRGRMRNMLGRSPLWISEGMAEWMAGGLNTMDEMLLRDAVVNDFVPTIEEIAGAGGYYIPYVYGNAIYLYIEETYGEGAVKDFVWELRKNGTGQSGIRRAIEELFHVEHDRFSRQLRQWLRDRYVPDLVQREEPEEYGEMIVDEDFDLPLFSPVPAPSGDLVAAITFRDDDLDVVLVSGQDGSLFSNLTPGFTNRYDYVIAQGVVVKFNDGRDLAWSPDGRLIAVLARRGRDRELLLIDAVRRRVERQIRLGVDQALNPAFMPDGQRVLFSANRNGIRDIYVCDLRTEELTNLTDDEAFDYSPVPSPDGSRVVYTSVVDGQHTKLFMFDFDNPETKTQLTFGRFHDKQPAWSPDGSRLVYVSSETGIYDIYVYELETGTIGQHTDVLGGAFQPYFDPRAEEQNRIYFSGFLKLRYRLYNMELGEPIRTFSAAQMRVAEAGRAVGFAPVVQVPIQEERMDRDPRFRFHLDDIFVYGGVASDGTVLSLAMARFADIFGDESLTLVFNTIGPYRSYDIAYFNQRRRFNWGVHVYDHKSFLAGNPVVFAQPQDIVVERSIVENLGVRLYTRYPFNRFVRAEFYTGFNNRTYEFDAITLSNLSPDFRAHLDERFASGNFIYFGTSLVGDTARYNPAFGPIAGRRWQLGVSVAPGIGGDFLDFTTVTAELRNYLRLNSATLIASRAFFGFSGGAAADIFVFGGLNTLRGVPFYSMVGNRAFYINNELRFPLVNLAIFPLGIRLANIRGLFFWDIGGAWYRDQEFTLYEDSRLKDAISSLGFGITFNFAYLPLNFTWSRSWDFKDFGSWEFDFWIGPKF